MKEDLSDKTDAAALGAGVVAVAMTVFGDPSAYDLLTLIVSVTLLVLIFGYMGRSSRDWLKSLAYAAVIAIIGIPILGYLFEERPGPWADEKALASGSGTISTISDPATVVTWVGLAVAVFLGDRWLQRRLVRAEASPD